MQTTQLKNSATSEQPDYTAIKQKQQSTWASGNYALIGSTLQVSGENLCEAMDLRSGRTVLDVAAGNGNASVAAARRFCQVTSTDYVPELLEKGRLRAEANAMQIDFQTADAENLPFGDEQFDYVVSTFGVMFAPNQAQCAAELLRVCKTGGKIGMANWTPASFIGQLFKTIGRYVPPPAGVSSPALWGTEAFLNDHFAAANKINTTSREFCFRYESAEHWLDMFRTYYGPTFKAFSALADAEQAELAADIKALLAEFNRSGDNTLVVPSEYLEIVISK